jgi:hypothetical protein
VLLAIELAQADQLQRDLRERSFAGVSSEIPEYRLKLLRSTPSFSAVDAAGAVTFTMLGCATDFAVSGSQIYRLFVLGLIHN